MSTKFNYIRLKIPSLTQGNDKDAESAKWCGRTVAAMIYNYYIATRHPGGLDGARGELIINQRDKTPYNFVFVGGPRANEIAVNGYNLVAAIQQAKPDGWICDELFPVADGARAAVLAGQPLDEAEVVRRMGPVLRSIESFNPAMIYTGLSSSDGLFHNGKRREVRHLVCVSGYRRDGDGMLWLHIDDPSSRAFDSKGNLQDLTIESVMEATKLLGMTDAVQQLQPDCVTHEHPGRRYWLRAAALFQPNGHSRHSSTDFWCDHENSPGFQVWVNHELEPIGSMVELGGDPRYPVALFEDDPKAVSKLWDAVATAGDPYPLSARRSWHNGIHIPRIEGITDERVFPIAPGRVVLAWFPPRTPKQPDRGMIVMRHALDLATLGFVDAREADPPEGAVWVHSLYANLIGGPAGAAPVLAKLRPKGGRPAPRRFGKVGTPIQLLMQSGAVLTPVVDEGLPQERPEADLVPVPDTTSFAIRQEKSYVTVWSDAAAADAEDSPHHAVKLRLDARESRLMGVQLDGKPWVLDGDVVKVKEGYTGTEARLFRNFKGSGTTRSFPEPVGAVVAVTVDASTTLHPVEVFTSNRLQRALVEVREVITLSDNAAEIAEWDRKHEIYEDLSDRLCGKSFVDLEGEEPEFRDFADEQIALMGVQREEGDSLTLGVHVEVFSKENFTSKTTVGGRWSELVEAPGFGNGTADFFKAQLDQLLSASRNKQGAGGDLTSDPSLQGPAGDSHATSLLSLHDDGVPITIKEWLAYCATPDNARWLSQIVAKHRSEWSLDLVVDASNEEAMQGLPAELRKALFTTHPSGPGLGTDTYYYFHPLRLVEWLRTGISVSLVDLPTDVSAGVGLVLRLGDTEVDLVRQGKSDCYRLRMVLGDGADEQDGEDDDDVAGTSRGVLILSGIDTTNPEIEVELKRNEITGLTLTQPGGSAATIRDVGNKKFGTPFASGGILVAEGEEHTVHLLSDLGGPLDDLACTRAVLSLEVRYNVALPDRLKLTPPGAGFAIESLEVFGAELGESSGTPGFDLPLMKLADEDDDDDDGDELVTMSSTVLVKAVVVATGKGRASDSVQIEVSGGDLTEPVLGEWQLVQRDIPFDARGQDVAKLQVYLSQILCGAIGCLRGSEGAVGSVDGHYGPATSHALWRFLLHYRDWSGPSCKVPTSAGDVELDGLVRTQLEIEEQVTALHESHEGPLVTQALLDLVVSYYRLPFIGAPIAVTLDPPKLLVPIPEVEKKWAGWNNKARTRVVPLPNAIELHVRFDVTDTDVPGELSSVGVTVELQDAAAYRLTSPACNTLADLVEVGVTLVPSGKLAPDAKPKLIVTAASGGQLAAIDLGGASDIRVSESTTGLDAAMIQHWLRVFPKKKDSGYLSGVDGNFGSGSKKALEDFCKDEFKKSESPTYVQILEALRGDMCTYEEDDLGADCATPDPDGEQCTMEEAAE